MSKSVCTGSNQKQIVSDYDVIRRTAKCNSCGQLIVITIPDPRMHGNIAKFKRHKPV